MSEAPKELAQFEHWWNKGYCGGYIDLSHYAVAMRAWTAARASQWRDIETAPKDGTWILGINNRGNQAVIIWSRSAYDRDGRAPGWTHPFSDGSLSIFWNGANGSAPTHWQPLPQPPVSK